jgi:hypothetical protein
MKYNLLKEDDTIKLFSGIKIIHFDDFPDPNGVSLGESSKKVEQIETERPAITTEVYTDGQIKKMTSVDFKQSEIPNIFNKVEANKKELKELELTNHSYVIVVIKTCEFQQHGNVCGLYDVIKDVKVYLKNPKDRTSLRRVKDTLDLIYPSSQMNSKVVTIEPSPISYDYNSENVYTLTRKY